jgi:hypothetical protein
MDICPRRVLLSDRVISHALEIHNHTGGRLGADVRSVPCQLVEAVDSIGDGVAARREEEAALKEERRRISRGR